MNTHGFALDSFAPCFACAATLVLGASGCSNGSGTSTTKDGSADSSAAGGSVTGGEGGSKTGAGGRSGMGGAMVPIDAATGGRSDGGGNGGSNDVPLAGGGTGGTVDASGGSGFTGSATPSTVLLSCGSLGGAGTVHWVSPTGTAAWTACVGTTALADKAACSLATANASAAAGDTIYLRGGIYSTLLSPKQGGTQAAGITFKNADGDTVLISGVAVAIDLKKLSYITIDGIAADTVDYWLRLKSSDHICVFNSTFTNLRSNARPNWPDGIVIAENSHHNWVKNCTAGGIGYALTDCSGPCAIGGMFLGDWEIGPPYDESSFNLIENNTFYHGGHHVLEINSPSNIIRNNYFHNENWTGTCAHPETNGMCADRNIIIEDNVGDFAIRNVIDGNVIAYGGVPADGDTSTGMSIRTQSNIVRNNLFIHNDGPGITLYEGSGQSYSADYTHIFSNVFFHNGFTAVTMTSSDVRYNSGLLFDHTSGTSGAPIANVAIKNNLFWDNNVSSLSFYYTDIGLEELAGNYYQSAASRGSSGNSTVDLPAGNIKSSADPLFMNTSGTPDVSNPNQFDFHLQARSPAIDQGVFLTTTSSAGSGTVIPVQDASYFIDGFGIVEGDPIQLQGQMQVVRIASVDYATNKITVDASLTWTSGLGVCLPYAGAKPDIGAFER
jgi:hypothetical protein